MSRAKIPLEDVTLLSTYAKNKFPLSKDDMKIFDTVDCKKIIRSIVTRFYIPNKLVFYYGGIDQQDFENITQYYALVYIASYKDYNSKSYFSFMYSFIIQRLIVLYRSIYRRSLFYIYNNNQDYEEAQNYLSDISVDDEYTMYNNYEDMLVDILDMVTNSNNQEELIEWFDKKYKDSINQSNANKKLSDRIRKHKQYLNKNIEKFKDILLQYTQSEDKEFRNVAIKFCKKYKFI